MSKTRHVVLAEPGDVLLIGNVHPHISFDDNNIPDTGELDRLGELLKKIGIQVIFFANEIDIAMLPASGKRTDAPTTDQYGAALEVSTQCAVGDCGVSTGTSICSRCGNKHYCVKHFYSNEAHPCSIRQRGTVQQ